MPKSFKEENIRTVLKNSSPELLRQYFNGHNWELDEDYAKNKKKSVSEFVDSLFNRVEAIPAQTEKNRIKSDLQKVFVMRNEKAILGVIREARQINPDIAKLVEETKNNFDQSLILFLNDKKSFDEFYLVYDSGHFGKRWWDARNDYVSEENQEISDDALKQITAKAKAYLESENKGRKYCEKRVSFIDQEYIFAFFEDSPHEQLEIKDGELEISFSNPVDKVVFLYDKKHKFVKVLGGDRVIRTAMHKIFAKEVFNEERIEEEQVKNEIYNIAHAFEQLIANKSINFEIGAKSTIKNILPSLVKLRIKNTGETIEIDAGKKGESFNDLNQSLAKFIAVDHASSNEIDIEDLEVLWMEFAVSYQDGEKLATKKIRISNRNKISNIGEEDVDFEILDCLKSAGILTAKESD